MSIFPWRLALPNAKSCTRWLMPAVLAAVMASPCWCLAQEPAKEQPKPAQEPAKEQPQPAQEPAKEQPKPDATEQPQPAPGAQAAPAEKLKGPDKIPDVVLVPDLRTIRVAHDRTVYNVQMVSAALLPRDKEGIWVLDFAFKTLRIKTVDIPGKGRRNVFYLYYKVSNRTGKPRIFVPEFVMVNEAGQKFEDNVIPQAVPLIQAREDATIPILGAVNVMGMIPPSTRPDVDEAVYGVATWDKWDLKADRFSIYVRGLSDGYKETVPASGGKPTVKYKTLRIDFIRRGDELHVSEKEIYLNDPPFEWVYW